MENLVSYEEFFTLIAKSQSFLTYEITTFISAIKGHKGKVEIKNSNFKNWFSDSEESDYLRSFVKLLNSLGRDNKNWYIPGHPTSYKLKNYNDLRDYLEFFNRGKHKWDLSATWVGEISCRVQRYEKNDKFSFTSFSFTCYINNLLLEYAYYKGLGVPVIDLEKTFFHNLNFMYKMPKNANAINPYGDKLGNLGCSKDDLDELTAFINEQIGIA